MRTIRPLALAAALAGCAGGHVTVLPTGTSPVLYPSRGPDCRVEFYRVKPPDRPCDEIAALNLQGPLQQTVVQAQEAMRKEACGIGADVVVITRDFAVLSNGVTMIGSALRYRDLTSTQRTAADRPITVLDKVAPEGYCVAALKGGDVQVYSRPTLRHEVVATLKGGTLVWTPEGWVPPQQIGTSLIELDPGRDVRLHDGTEGYVDPAMVGPCLPPAPATGQPPAPGPVAAPGSGDAI